MNAVLGWLSSDNLTWKYACLRSILEKTDGDLSATVSKISSKVGNGQKIGFVSWLTARKSFTKRYSLVPLFLINKHGLDHGESLGSTPNVTVIPPTQGSRKNTVWVRNKTQRVNSLCFIQRLIKSYSISLFLMRIQSPTDTNRLSSSLSMTNNSVSRYICVSEPEPSAQTLIAKPNMVRNGALTNYSRAPSLINSHAC